jgi:helicase
MREIARLLRYDCVDGIDVLSRRVGDGIKEELLGLVRLRGVGRVRARSLFNNGYRTQAHLARADPGKLAQVPKIGPAVAEMILKQVGGGKADGPGDDGIAGKPGDDGNAGSPDGKTYFR